MFNHFLTTKDLGNFDTRSISLDNFSIKLSEALDNQIDSDYSSIFVPSLNHTTNIVDSSYPDSFNWLSASVFKSSELADGIVISKGEVAGITLADCLAVCVYDENRLSLLHVNFRTLIPKDPSISNIIDSLFEKEIFNPQNVSAWIGAGIGSCCFGAEHYAEIGNDINTISSELTPHISMATEGPRKGQISIDLRSLADFFLRKNEVRSSKIKIDDECTSCAKIQNQQKYWSHTIAKSNGLLDGRNLFLTWLT